MLKRLAVKGFKSLTDVELTFPQLTVLFGPNAAGKSNLLEAIQAISRIGTRYRLTEALSKPIRGYPLELFAFPQGGLPALLNEESASLTLESDVRAPAGITTAGYRYRVTIEVQPSTGALTVADEFLAELSPKGKPRRWPLVGVRRGARAVLKSHRSPSLTYARTPSDRTVLADPSYSSFAYPKAARCHRELESWRTYYLDPRVAMRTARPPAQVSDIGMLGEDIAPFLHRLCVVEPKRFAAVKRTLRTLVPSVEDLSVDLDPQRGTLDIQVRQDGTLFSSRVISEGTLRVLALCAITASPMTGALIGFEEPENGVHPRRLELIAQLLVSLALEQGRQVIVTTHSPLFCDAILKHARERPEHIALVSVRHGPSGTKVRPLDLESLALAERNIAESMTTPSEDGLFEALVLRGHLDE